MGADGTKQKPEDLLDGWKQIAEHLGKTERTVQRWEKSKGLPVRRLQADSSEEQPRVFAYRSEIESWWKEHQTKLTEDSDDEPQPWRRAIFISLSIVLALGVTATLWFLFPAKRVLGVAPVRNLSPVGDTVPQQLAEALTEELVTRLGLLKPKRFSVIQLPPESATSPPDQVAKAYHLDYLLKGSVQRAGTRVAVTAELILAKDQSKNWGNIYERSLENPEDIIPIEIEITRDITAQIMPLLPHDKSPNQQVNHDAYQAYLWGRLLWDQRTAESLYQAIPYFQKAIDLDPTYAPAYVGLADCYFLLGSVPYTALPPNEAFPKSEAAARKALELDNSLAEAHVSLGYSALVYRRDFAEAEKQFKSALKLRPEYPTGHEFYAYYLTAMGRVDEAIRERRIARELEPRSPLLNTALGEAYYEARQFDRAIQEHQKALLAHPGYPDALMNLARSFEQLGQYAQADPILTQMLVAAPNEPAVLALAGHEYAVSGRPAQARALLARLRQIQTRRYVSPLLFALIYMGLGDKNNIFQELDQAYAERSEYLVYLRTEPWADPLRGDPRFAELIKKLGFPAEQASAAGESK